MFGKKAKGAALMAIMSEAKKAKKPQIKVETESEKVFDSNDIEDALSPLKALDMLKAVGKKKKKSASM